MKELFILLFLTSNLFAFKEYQEVNPEFKLFTLKGQVEMYSSGEEKLYEYESPYGHFYSPQGWGHQEEITIDLRRIQKDLIFIAYVPIYFKWNFKTFPYVPYADSLQIIGTKLGLMLPLFTIFNTNFYYNFEGSAQTWSGQQVTTYENKLILQSDFGIENKKYPLHVFNVSFGLERNSGIPLIKLIDKEGNKFGYDSALRGDLTIDTRPIGGIVFCGYNFEHTWIWNNKENNKQAFLQSIFLGQEVSVDKDLGLELEGDFEWRDNIRIFKMKAQFILRTNL